MKNSNAEICQELASKTQGGYTGNEIVFDPDTGNLIVHNKKDKKPVVNATILDGLYNW